MSICTTLEPLSIIGSCPICAGPIKRDPLLIVYGKINNIVKMKVCSSFCRDYIFSLVNCAACGKKNNLGDGKIKLKSIQLLLDKHRLYFSTCSINCITAVYNYALEKLKNSCDKKQINTLYCCSSCFVFSPDPLSLCNECGITMQCSETCQQHHQLDCQKIQNILADSKVEIPMAEINKVLGSFYTGNL